MGVTLNKDGKPRKIGSGKTKGAGCYEKIALRDLRKLVNENTEVSVSRVWLRNAQAEKMAHSIQFDLQPPKVKPEYVNRFLLLSPQKRLKSPLKKKSHPMLVKRIFRMITNHPHFLLQMQGFVTIKAMV